MSASSSSSRDFREDRRGAPETSASLTGIALELQEQRLVADVGRHCHHLRVAAPHQLGVDHEVIDPDVGEQSPVAVPFPDVELEAHVLARHQRAVLAGRGASSGFFTLAGMVDLRGVDPDVTDALHAPAEPDMDGVAVDDPDNDALEKRALGHRGAHRSGQEDEEGDQNAKGRGHVPNAVTRALGVSILRYARWPSRPGDVGCRLTSPSTILDSWSNMREKVATPAVPDINGRIARRVRTLRADLGMTLDALAARSEVSRSMLSLVERGESSPTAVVLEKIAYGLGVSLATLFEDASAPANPVARRDDRTAWRDPQSGYVRRNISPANVPSPIQIVEIVLPAGARVAYDTGARDVSIHQQIWVQAGSIEVTVGNTTYRLTEDDCLAMQLNEPTAFRNRTRKPARYLVIIASDRPRVSRSDRA